MTIGVGLLCRNGIVLGTDTQYTTGGFLKTFGPKIFKVAKRADVAVILAGAGRVPFMKTAVERIGRAVEQLPADPSAESVKEAAEDALLKFYTRHIYPAPKDIRPSFELLVGSWTVEGLHLYKSDLTNLVPVAEYGFLGIGEYVACHALELIRGSDIGIEQGKCVAAYSIKAAKDYADACGKETKIWTLDDGGEIQQLSAQEICDIEQYCDGLEQSMQFLLLGLDVEDLSEPEFDILVDSFRRSLASFKLKQKEHKDKALKRRQP